MFTENVISWETGDKKVVADFSQRKFTNKMKKLKAEHPEEVEIMENPDGSLHCYFPAEWVRVRPPRQMSEETRARMAEHMAAIRQDRNKEED